MSSAQSYEIDHFLVLLVLWVLSPKFWGSLRGDLRGNSAK